MKISNSIAGLVAAAGLFIPLSAQAQVFDYTIVSTDPTINAWFIDGNCSTDGPSPAWYKTVTVTVTTAGTYVFTDTGPGDATAALYSTFSPASPKSDCVRSMDSTTTGNLTPGTYTLLLANRMYAFGDFSVTVTGPAPLVVVPPPAAVPTLSEWAMILFGAVMAGGAALYIQRRRRAA